MSTVATSLHDGIAVLRLNNPPVNIGNTALRGDLARALRELASLPRLDGVVITSALTHFYAGSDISEFAGELREPQLPSVIADAEQLDVPVVAALTGLVLGGGLEFALGCDVRIADPSVRLGFPEVTLGMVPGAGGTVRTPRLTGVPAAVELIASGRRIDADEALDLGLLTEVVPADKLVARAIEIARSVTCKSRTIDIPVPPSAEGAVGTVITQMSRRARPNGLEAIDLVCRAGEGDVQAALANERQVFTRLRHSSEAGNLRYLFFARRAATKALHLPIPAKPIGTVGIAGAGTMGASLARTFTEHGYSVIVYDRNPAALERLAERAPTVIRTTDVIADLANADLVIDAVFEEMQVKIDLLDALEPVLRDDAVIASNTSYLDLEQMSQALAHRERFAGLHFFNPPNRNPLVELIRTPATDDTTAATLAHIAGRLDKIGIPAGIGDGFVANRVYADYRTQVEFIVEEGASPSEVDNAMRDLGMPIGPFAVADMSGLDIAWARRKRLAATRDPRQRYVTIADRLCEAGRLGRKTGAGWFTYPDGARRGEPDVRVDEIIRAERAATSIGPRSVPAEEIRNRVLASMLCAAAVLVESGIAQRASDIDLAMTEGFAFPKYLGGPIRTMSARPEHEVIEALAIVYASCPVTFAVAEPASRGILPPAVATCLEQVRDTDDAHT